MRAFHCSRRLPFWLAAVAAVCQICLSGPVRAETASRAGKAGTSEDPIRISAQSLVADDLKKYAEFIGNVRAVQGKTVITSDRLKLFYEGAPGNGQGRAAPGSPDTGEGITKIVATGRVKIEFEEMLAEGQEAVYTIADRILVISGPDAKVIRDKSGAISGAKITVHRNDGRIKFEGGVEGVFFPGDKGLD